MNHEIRTVILPLDEYRELIIRDIEYSRIEGRLVDIDMSIQSLKEDIYKLYDAIYALKGTIERSNEE